MDRNTYRIARGASCRAAKWKPVDVTWADFLSRLNSPARTGETVAEYKRMTKAEKASAKDVGGFVAGELLGGKRSNRTVRCRSMVTLDADKAYPGQWEDVTLLCEYRMAMYSTHSHTPDEPRLRFIVPLDRDVSADEYGAIARRLAKDIGIETMDRTTYEPARLMYWPSCPADGEYLFRQQDGPVVCADEILAGYGPDEAWRDTTLWPAAADEAEVVHRELKELGDPQDKPGLIGAFCRTYDVEEAISEFLPEVYEPCDTHSREPRYTYTGGSTYGGVSVYNDGLYLFSRHDTDPAGGGVHCQNAFDLVRIHKFGHLDKGNLSPEPTRRPSYKAMCEWASGLDAVKKLLADERIESSYSDFADLEWERSDSTLDDAEPLSDDEILGAAEADADDGEWKQQLSYHPKTGELEPTAANVLLIMRNDPWLKGVIGYNELLERVVLLKPAPWHRRIKNKRDGDDWIDSDSANLRVYLERVWGLKNRADIQDSFQVVQDENRFNPLQDYLKGLVWDGTERLDTLLIRYLRAEDTAYTRAVTRKWFTAAVARAMCPGRKFDNMLVLVGAQGVGKSTLLQIMSRGRFSDSITDLKGKTAYEQLRGVWLVEFAELASMKRAEVETIKNFVSKTEDSYRPAYAVFNHVYKRMCVFFGTTNEQEFLKDRTGARRFWPVKVNLTLDDVVKAGGAMIGLEEEVDQLWAEAVVRWRDGEPLWLSDSAVNAAAVEAQDRFSVPDELAGMIAEYLEKRLPDNWDTLSVEDRAAFIQGRSPLELGECTKRRDVVCVSEIRCEMCGEEKARNGGNDILSRRIANVMNNLPGWENTGKRMRVSEYGLQRVYCRIASAVKGPECDNGDNDFRNF